MVLFSVVGTLSSRLRWFHLEGYSRLNRARSLHP